MRKHDLRKIFLSLLTLLTWAVADGLNALSLEEIERLKQLTPEQKKAVVQMLQDGYPGDDEPANDTSVDIGPHARTREFDRKREQRTTGAPPGESRTIAVDAPPIRDSEGDRERGDEAEASPEDEARDQPSPAQELARFGYDLFRDDDTSFLPATDIPVPDDYVLGPGDTLRLQIYGKINRQHRLVVSREGRVLVPDIGPVMVTGMRFDEVKSLLRDRITRQLIGAEAAISMGRLRSIRVFILGDVRQPGSYTISALSTMTNALLVSGGITPVGTLRKIELKRNGSRVTRLDLYDLLLKGDTRHDVRLQPGDVIFVPPVGATVGVSGEVKRPAIYELRHEKQVKELIGLAGGMLPTAYPPAAQLERILNNGTRTTIDLDLSRDKGLGFRIKNGDVLHIPSTLERMDSIVLLSGHVERAGRREWHEGARLTDLIPSAKALKPGADLDYLVVRRELKPDRRIKVLSTSLREAFAHPDSGHNIVLEPRDEIFVFAQGTDRTEHIGELLQELRDQAGSGRPAEIVTIGGHIRIPGDYPLVKGMRISDLIRAGGGLSESAYTVRAEMTRYEVVRDSYREIEHLSVDMKKVLAGEPSADTLLQPHDSLQILRVPEWVQTAKVEIRGEVRFPGVYPIARGEQLSSLLRRAGGLTDFAFPEGTVFMRKALRVKEKKQLDTLAQRLEADLASAALKNVQADATQTSTIEVGRALIKQLRGTRPVGRLVIDLPRLIATSRDGRVSDYDVTLKDGDEIVIPKLTQEVTVIGEVFHPTSHLYAKKLDKEDYINMSGGATRKADTRNVYVVRANGAVIANRPPPAYYEEVWFERGGKTGIRPGDTIVVPMDVDRIRPLTLWTNISQIAYQIGIALAAANAVGIF
ncbi:MAG TPA: ATPase [Kiloniellaceae bacterium]|nr:ATPase [Kiloniellaceae bacterium]